MCILQKYAHLRKQAFTMVGKDDLQAPYGKRIGLFQGWQ